MDHKNKNANKGKCFTFLNSPNYGLWKGGCQIEHIPSKVCSLHGITMIMSQPPHPNVMGGRNRWGGWWGLGKVEQKVCGVPHGWEDKDRVCLFS